MEIFSLNSFILGVLIFLSSSLTILIYAWLCVIWNIKIVEVVILTNSWYSLKTKNISGTNYILGWLPLGSHIRPLGMMEDDISDGKVSDDDLERTFLSKSFMQQRIFRSVKSIMSIVVFVLALYGVNYKNNDIFSNFMEIEKYVWNALKSMWNPSLYREDFINLTKVILIDKSKTLFTFLLLMNFIILFIPIGKFMNWFADDKKRSTFEKTFGILLSLICFYLILWVVPSFVFSFFSLFSIFSYIVSTILGIYLVGFLVYGSLVFLAQKRSL